MGIDYNNVIVTDGLVGYFDVPNTRSYPGSGTSVIGLIGGIGATLVNGVGFTSTYNGYFSFDGSNDYLDFGNSSQIQLTTGTICVWCRTSNPGGSFRGIVAKQFAYGLFYTDSILTIYDWSVPRTNSTGINLADGKWKHVSLTFSSGVANQTIVYLNGSGILTTTYTISNNTSNLFVGAEQNANQNANCNISQVQVYNRALSAVEILQNYNATKGRYR